MLLGFSTGVLYRQMTTKQALKVMQKLECRVVEIGLVRKDYIDQGWLSELKGKDLKSFQYVSLHAPRLDYGDNDETKDLFKQINNLHAQRPLDLVVFHPDDVKDIEVFDNVLFPVGFENMDSTKFYGRTTQDIEKLLSHNSSFRLILDVNHIKDNDPSMKLADDFYDKFGDKIVEYHLSGINSNNPHLPLFQIQQLDIMNAIRDITIPIICEGVLTPDTVIQEKVYIEKFFNK